MEEVAKEKVVRICDECGSKYYESTSKMASLCPECTHLIYGYENCVHDFKNGRCLKCFWDGRSSDYIKYLKNE